ncbi:hypothetical protein PHYBLDRAFT_59479 [Phycomyces blakesleeanus NRRL 1555(-)]|uniref:Uncharacterized protein n=1 Tax=Phycomyces blakesleeanus (strain ATCC 8743b / DSM 1359 / FGSC 10004 / NBRC 33097 / NRRL 1555) TaxID=763407 RepID=A0A162UG02_PHYB8|nr:hypothetical protein PHYBLDRAFT_59479 [Phycomyces blakesleeanus NRRL 1555(-)]OAD75952.1 hypothetical protein PHYBLDRAFT_59479 [Phycomyces blakesleeanus NRRL 1555(-)]|eukprot:XP_018293992.1 hypothetical protein PHYBLDRAFT_59479 [Phycomyces blakesleeanus NRRL 1555(-)]
MCIAIKPLIMSDIAYFQAVLPGYPARLSVFSRSEYFQVVICALGQYGELTLIILIISPADTIVKKGDILLNILIFDFHKTAIQPMHEFLVLAAIFVALFCLVRPAQMTILQFIQLVPECSLMKQFVVSHDYMHITIAGDFNVDFTRESIKKATLLQFMNNRNMTTTLPNTIRSTTSQNNLIDNILLTMPVLDSGRYISLTSCRAPLWTKSM